MELAPYQGSAPLGEPSVRSWPGRPEDRRQLPPRAACRESRSGDSRGLSQRSFPASMLRS